MAHVLNTRRRWLIGSTGALLLATPALAQQPAPSKTKELNHPRHADQALVEARMEKPATPQAESGNALSDVEVATIAHCRPVTVCRVAKPVEAPAS